MSVELFSVTCITCQSRLKVRHEGAIGQILACPKCGGMVQIEPPPGWKPPAKPADAPTDAPSAERKPAGPRHPRPTGAAAAPEATPADDAPLAPPEMIVAPHEAAARKWVLLGGGVLAMLIVGFGLWTSFGSRTELPIEPALAIVSPTKSATRSATSSATRPTATATATATPAAATPAAATASPSPSPTSVAAASTPTASGTPTLSASPTATPSAAPSASAPPILVASASPTVPPPPIAIAGATPSASAPVPVASATPTVVRPPLAAPSATPVFAPAPQIDLAARLADKFPEIAFDRTPLRQALATLAQLSTIRIQYDADSLAAEDAKIDSPITVTLRDTTVEAAIAKLTAEQGLQFRAVGDQIVVFAPAKDAAASATVAYPVDDLVGTDEAATRALADLVRRFTVPDAWDEKWGGRLDVAAGKLDVTQQAAGQREVAAFLDRLRLARGKTPKDSKATLETRFRRARELLDAPVTMNFRPAAALPAIAARIEAATGATLLIDYLELGTQGFFGSDVIGIAADKQPVERVLAALCDPRDWGWRIVGPKWIEITTGSAIRRRPYVEFYALPSPPLVELDGPGWVAKIRTALADEAWRDAPGVDPQTAGEIAFDDASQRLIVRQHQGAQGRIERLLAENVKSPPAPLAPRATATPSGTAAPSGTAPRPTATGSATPLTTGS